MGRSRLWLRRSFARRGLLLATLATTLVGTFLIATICGLALQSQQPAVRESVSAGPSQTVGIRWVVAPDAMMELLIDLVHNGGIAAIVTTHDPMLMKRADRVLELHDGRLRLPHGHGGRHAAPVPADDADGQ